MNAAQKYVEIDAIYHRAVVPQLKSASDVELFPCSRHLHLGQPLRQSEAIAPLLAVLMHALLRWHWVGALLLLLHVRLVLQRLLLVGRHVGRLRNAIPSDVLRHGLRHGRDGGVGLFWRLHCGLAIYAVGVGGLGCIEAGLQKVLVGEGRRVLRRRVPG